MIKKAEKIVSQKTLDSKNIRVSVKGKKIKCEFCKTNVVDMIRHLQKCHCNPKNSPEIKLDWDNLNEYDEIEEFLIKNPCTDKEDDFNKLLAPKGNLFEEFKQEILDYTISLPKGHKDKMINAKLNEIFTSGVDVRLLNKDEFIERLKEKVRKGYRIFLFDPLKPTTIEEIEANKDILWRVD